MKHEALKTSFARGVNGQLREIAQIEIHRCPSELKIDQVEGTSLIVGEYSAGRVLSQNAHPCWLPGSRIGNDRDFLHLNREAAPGDRVGESILSREQRSRYRHREKQSTQSHHFEHWEGTRGATRVAGAEFRTKMPYSGKEFQHSS